MPLKMKVTSGTLAHLTLEGWIRWNRFTNGGANAGDRDQAQFIAACRENANNCLRVMILVAATVTDEDSDHQLAREFLEQFAMAIDVAEAHAAQLAGQAADDRFLEALRNAMNNLVAPIDPEKVLKGIMREAARIETRYQPGPALGVRSDQPSVLLSAIYGVPTTTGQIQSAATLPPRIEVPPALLQQYGETGASGASPATAVKEPDHPYVFRNTGEVVEVQFEGEAGKFVQSLGAQYVAKLFERPNRQIAAGELSAAVRPSPADKSEIRGMDTEGLSKVPTWSTDDVIDAEGLSNVERELAEFDDDIERAKRDDPASVDVLIAERERILQETKAATGAFEKRRRLSEDSARSSVAAAINRFVKNCEKAGMTKFAKHLTGSIATGQELAYRPAGMAPDWRF
ncbi:MAG TPA: hypothetical protein VGP76_13020 [Planctomycetaceae bacterium]|nr:hypothetical protein [Planctomycetaceae bacterium]